MESTKEQVLHLLQARGGATVAALAGGLGVGPAFVFYATEAAEERTPGGYSRLLSRLYRGLSALDERHVRGRDGTQVLRRVFEGAAEQVPHQHQREGLA